MTANEPTESASPEGDALSRVRLLIHVAQLKPDLTYNVELVRVELAPGDVWSAPMGYVISSVEVPKGPRTPMCGNATEYAKEHHA